MHVRGALEHFCAQILIQSFLHMWYKANVMLNQDRNVTFMCGRLGTADYAPGLLGTSRGEKNFFSQIFFIKIKNFYSKKFFSINNFF